ncbi:MAG: hypothetical protein WCW65_00710 [Candidatus Paceibacterota bacterium]
MPVFSFAETQITVQEDEIIVSVSPKNPQPYEEVSISLSSFATDLNKAIITWQIDSKIVLSGIGKTGYSLTASGPNTTILLNITIKPVGAINTISKRIILSPSEVELLWESLDGYVPPFYKGKAFPSRGGTIKVIAIPNTDTIKSGSGSISYTWKNNGEVLLGVSGYNKNSYVFKNDLFDSKNEITVTTSSVGENYNAEKTIEVGAYNPKILFYKKSPTEGVLYNTALENNTILNEDEMTLVAVPYFLAIKGNEDNFLYNWSINGDPIQTPSKKTELTIRPTSRGGYADINLVLESVNELFQKVTGQLRLTL